MTVGRHSVEPWNRPWARQSLALPDLLHRSLIEFVQHLPFQMLTGGFLDRAPLVCDCLLFCLSFSARARIERTRQMRNLRAFISDLSLLGLCIRIHKWFSSTESTKID